jgi:hypothetical protein
MMMSNSRVAQEDCMISVKSFDAPVVVVVS